MNGNTWTITFNCPDWEVKNMRFCATTKQLIEMTRNHEFHKMINGSWVEGALISYAEAGPT